MEHPEQINLGSEGYCGQFILIQRVVRRESFGVTDGPFYIRTVDTKNHFHWQNGRLAVFGYFMAGLREELATVFPEVLGPWDESRGPYLAVGEWKFFAVGGGYVIRDEVNKRIVFSSGDTGRTVEQGGPYSKESVPILAQLVRERFPDYEIEFDQWWER